MHRTCRAALALFVIAQACFAQSTAPDAVLVEIGTIKLMKSDYEAELLKLPPSIRPGFANSPQRVNDLLNRMIVQKVLAAQAEERKLAETPANAARIRLEMERVLAQLRIADIEERAGREFDARRSQFEARAR